MTVISFDTSFARPETPSNASASARPAVGAELRAVLARHDDRLLKDIGLTRADVLGIEGIWNAERTRLRAIWNL